MPTQQPFQTIAGLSEELFERPHVEKIIEAARAGKAAWRFMKQSDRILVAALLQQNLNLRTRTTEQAKLEQELKTLYAGINADGMTTYSAVEDAVVGIESP